MVDSTLLRNGQGNTDRRIDVLPTRLKNVRPTISAAAEPRRLRYEDYTVGWIYALPKEIAAGQAMLDEVHASLPSSPRDSNTYTLGSIGPHNIVMACLPAGQYSTNKAAIVGANMIRTFPRIVKRLMVGIGGGAPGSVDLRLGDVVVSDQVIQYDLGKALPDGRFVRTSIPMRPPAVLMTAVSKLRANHDTKSSQITPIIEGVLEECPGMTGYEHPQTDDWLLSTRTTTSRVPPMRPQPPPPSVRLPNPHRPKS